MKNYQDFLTINYNKELIPGLFEMELEGEGARFITAPVSLSILRLTTHFSHT